MDNRVIRQEATSTAPTASPKTIATTAGGTAIVSANPNRLSVTLQNTGTEAVIIRLGGDPSTTAYNFVIGADSSARKGGGGSVTITDFTGAIKGIVEANSGTIAVTEVGK